MPRRIDLTTRDWIVLTVAGSTILYLIARYLGDAVDACLVCLGAR